MRQRKNNTQYFAEKEENAVIDYILSNNFDEKNKIYNEILIEPFRKMIQSILRRYPIHIGNYDMEEVESNALAHLIDHMVKYRPFIIERKITTSTNDKWYKLGDKYRFFYPEPANEKLLKLIENDDELKTSDTKNNKYYYRIFISKAFSYCQTIIRNYYKDHSKKSYNEKKTNLCFDDYFDEINNNNNYSYEIELETQHQLEKLINEVIGDMEEMINSETPMKKNEIVVGDAIINILRYWHLLFMEDSPDGNYNKKITNKFQKNKILFYLKEQTGLSTKEIRIAIKPFKEIYFLKKVDYLEE